MHPTTPPLPRRRAITTRPGLMHPEDVEAIATLQTDLDADEAALAAHLGDTADAHDASAISFAPAGGIAATDVQAAIAELDTEKAAASHTHAASAIASGNLDNARLPASGTDANSWAWWYYAPGKKMYSQRFAATSGASPDLVVANEAATPEGVTDFANLRIVGVEHDAAAGGSAINSAVRQGATATTIDVTASTTDGTNMDTKVATFNVDVTMRDS